MLYEPLTVDSHLTAELRSLTYTAQLTTAVIKGERGKTGRWSSSPVILLVAASEAGVGYDGHQSIHASPMAVQRSSWCFLNSSYVLGYAAVPTEGRTTVVPALALAVAHVVGADQLAE